MCSLLVTFSLIFDLFHSSACLVMQPRLLKLIFISFLFSVGRGVVPLKAVKVGQTTAITFLLLISIS
jgi:hypothetical protein